MFIWLGAGDSPWELTSYILRRDIYHCLPSELDEEDWIGVSNDIAIRNAIAKARR